MAIKWSKWEALPPLSENILSKPFVQQNQDGRLEVFAIARGEIFNLAQVNRNGGWRNFWSSKGRPASITNANLRSYQVGRNADGRQEIFALADDGALWQKWQTAPNNGWSEWKTLGVPAKDISLIENFTVGRNKDGRQEVFAIGSDKNIWQIWQTFPNGGWSNWEKLGQPHIGVRETDRISVGINEDHRQELFVMGKDNSVWHIWQVGPNIGWSSWESLGKANDVFDGSEKPKERNLSNPVVAKNTDGHLEVFAPGNGAFCNRWQERWRDGANNVTWRHQGWNEKPKPRPEVAIISLDVAINFESKLEVFSFSENGSLWHAWQVNETPFWSKWEDLGRPSTNIRKADQLTIGTNQDGRLEVFVVGEDNAIWHIWQTR
jgi:hypothetical protein